MSETTDEAELDIAVFRDGMHINDKEEADRRAAR